ncbi:oligo-1,6-glucosidase [Clostridiales bacterium KLE1615]|nr:oligo-1,6-glucosidase [Clostridiales bacterium KLE1615]
MEHMNEKWWKNAVVYQIYPRSFKDSNGDGIGDLEGIYEKLDYLAELGIDVIWMSPVYKSPNDDNGYDISDYQDIMDDFGTMDDFDRVLKKAHSLNIKIMMDLVVNHTSDEHKWFIESKKSKDNPYHDYYMWADPDKNGNPPNRWESCFSGSAWEYVESVGQFYLHSFSRKQPDLNWDNPKVREEVFKMMTWWCDKGIDGFRMDVISMISKYPGLPDGPENGNGYTGNTSCDGPNIHKYLREMNEKVLSKYRLITVGECPGVNAEQAKKYANIDGSELDMIFQFEHVSGSALKPCHHGKWDGEAMTMPELRANFTKWQKDLEGCAWNSLFLSNHDQPRCVSRFGNDSEQYRELSAKMLATMTHFQKGTPYVYQGEELGMTNAYMENIADYRDIESLNAYKELTTKENIPAETVMGYIKAVGRDNARTPMQWDASDNGGFTSGTPWLQVNKNYKTINADAQVNDPDSVFAYYKKLIALRHTNEVMVNGVYDVLIPDHPQIYAYTRTLGDKQLLVLCNDSDTNAAIPAEIQEKIHAAKNILIQNYKDTDESTLRPYEAVVYAR